ncbi:MAG: tRNA lysidine(34) synthetase TilS [Alphaproteobacteria bacterium]|nr:tRNA lysidine(34) synthetase TilS [Alphaproteobacteria bacterium]MBV8548205.1 tRNA lysidine(34) synthetase TilS [Alphaproteobacteria bacterium]
MSTAHTKNPEPLNEAEFAALMVACSLPPVAKLAVAVSGGPDSMALAACLQCWCQTHNISLQAFIVDHRLRSESTTEAMTVHKRLSALGIQANILTWQHDRVEKRLHETARQARYRLLTDACNTSGIQHLFIAHHADDQAETVLMRFAKGSGIDGLAGIAARQKRDGVTLWRPLLTIPKARLIATCDAQTIPFVKDPSNEAERFARGRLRQVMPLLAAEGMDATRVADLARRASDASEALRFYTDSFLQQHSKRDATGALWIDRTALTAQPRAIIMRALATCLQHIHPTPYMPDDAPLRELAQSIISDDTPPAFTLNGCLTYGAGQHIILLRELSAITDTPQLAAGQSAVWDNRLCLQASATLQGTWQVRALGLQQHDVLDALLPGFRKQVPQGRIRAAWPALWQGGKPVIIPSPDQARQNTENAVTIEFSHPWPPKSTGLTGSLVEN